MQLIINWFLIYVKLYYSSGFQYSRINLNIYNPIQLTVNS